MSDATAPLAGPPTSPPLLRTIADELQREDQRLLLPLLTRIEEIAAAIGEERAVDPEYVAEAVRLWGEYVTGLHQRRLEEISGVYRTTFAGEAPTHPGRKGRLLSGLTTRRPKKSGPRAETLQDRYNEIRGTQTRMAQRIGVLDGLVAAYRRHEYHSGQLLASLLRSGAFSDRAWARYEEEFVKGQLSETVPEDEQRVLRGEVEESDRLRSRLEEQLREFLARPIRLLSPAPTS